MIAAAGSRVRPVLSARGAWAAHGVEHGVEHETAGERHRVGPFDLDLTAGEWALVLGPSGCGKSTLLRLLQGSIPHALDADAGGEVWHGSALVGDASLAAAAAHCGFVAQDPATGICLGQVTEEVAFPLENLAWLGLVVVNATTRGDEALWHLGSIEFTRDGALVGLAFALRGAALGAFTLAFLASTPPRALMASLMRHARLSPRYAFALLAGHRALLVLPERWVQVRRARSQRLPAGDPRLGVRGFAACAFALLTHAIRDSERIALALESRGLGAGPRTELVPSRFTRADALMAALGVLALVALGWVGAAS